MTRRPQFKHNRSISPQLPFPHNIVCVTVVFLIVPIYLLNDWCVDLKITIYYSLNLTVNIN